MPTATAVAQAGEPVSMLTAAVIAVISAVMNMPITKMITTKMATNGTIPKRCRTYSVTEWPLGISCRMRGPTNMNITGMPAMPRAYPTSDMMPKFAPDSPGLSSTQVPNIEATRVATPTLTGAWLREMV